MSVRKLRRGRGQFSDISGSSTHGSLETEPSFRGLRARQGQTREGISQSSPLTPRPAKTHRIRRGSGTTKNYFDQPLDFGPNYEHTLAGRKHFASGGSPHWIQSALPPSSKGKLHARLGIPQGQKIPLKRIKKAEHSADPTLAKEARLADTLRKFHH